jgi:hypothetical protein
MQNSLVKTAHDLQKVDQRSVAVVYFCRGDTPALTPGSQLCLANEAERSRRSRHDTIGALIDPDRASR